MMFLFTGVFFCYGILLLFLRIGITKIPLFEGGIGTAEITFSVVVPYRNEAENLPFLLKSLLNLKFPPSRFEIILVNDASEDISEKICSAFQLEYPNLNIVLKNSHRKSGSPKKDALATGITTAKFKYVATTDADCQVPKAWLSELASFIQKTDAELVAGPVGILSAGKKELPEKFLALFQDWEFISLQACSIGAFGLEKPFLCNGANLCFKKESFLQIKGYQNNDHIASGDDVFLLEKFRKAGLRTAFLKSHRAIVQTLAQPTLNSMVVQHRRWATKVPAYKDNFGKIVGLIVALTNFSLVLSIFLMFFNVFSIWAMVGLFVFKMFLDLLFLWPVVTFFKKKSLLKHYLWSAVLYPLFSSYVILVSLFPGYTWKDRRFAK